MSATKSGEDRPLLTDASVKRSNRSTRSAVSKTGAVDDTTVASTHSAVTLRSSASKRDGGGRNARPKPTDPNEFKKPIYMWICTALYHMFLWSIFAVVAAGITYNLLMRAHDFPIYFGERTFIGAIPRVIMEPNTRRQLDITEKLVSDVLIRIYKDDDGMERVRTIYNRTMEAYNKPADGAVDCEAEPAKFEHAASDDIMKMAQADRPSCKIDITNTDPDVGYGKCAITEDAIKDTAMGLSTNEPCVMLRLTRMLGFYPPFKNLDSCLANRLQFECSAVTEFSKDVTFEYFPKKGISACFFPYWNSPAYRAPFVMVKMSKLPDECEIGGSKVECKHFITCRPSMPELQAFSDEAKNEIKFEITIPKKKEEEKEKEEKKEEKKEKEEKEKEKGKEKEKEE